MSFGELWMAYFGLGGNESLTTIRAHIEDDELIAARDHDLLVDALNDHFVGQGLNHPVKHSGQAREALVGRASRWASP